MLRAVGCRARASIGDCALVSRVLRSSGHDAAVDQSTSSRGLGLLGSSRPQARACVGRLNNLLPGAVKEALQVWNNLSLNGSSGGLGDAARPFQLNLMRGFVQLRTNLEVADNSGARRVQCIKVMKGSNAAQIGDTIMASVKDAQPRGKVKKGEVVTCVVVRAATHKLRRDGSEIKFDKNAVVLVNKQGEPIGTRIFGPVPHELRRRKLVKILTLAEHVT